MPSMFSRLYAYRERPTVSPLENFLTEAFAELFGRLPPDLQRSLTLMLLPASARTIFENVFPHPIRLSVRTQVAAASAGSTKYPDIVVYAGDRAAVVIEAKVGAALQQHEDRERPPTTGVDVRTMRNQLETYARWIAGVGGGGAGWYGAVVFLTAFTEPPTDFAERRTDRVGRSVRRWKDVGDWILDEVKIARRDTTHCALAAEFHNFLEEQDLMTKYMSAHDLAVAGLYVKSASALYDTFYDVLKAIGEHAPKLRGGRHYNADFWTEGNVYWGWFHFARSVKKNRTKPYVAVGICFEVSDFHAADAAKLPRHEPFFLVACEDDWGTEKPAAFLTAIPDGWIEIGDDWMIVAARPVREFSPDPDLRVEELKTWARSEMDKLIACVPGYGEAKFEAAPAEDSEKE